MYAIYVISPHLRDCWLPERVMCVMSAQAQHRSPISNYF